MWRKTAVLCLVFLSASVSAVLAQEVDIYDLKADFAADSAELKFVKMIAETLTPEALTVIFERPPESDGFISDVYIAAEGVSANTPYRLAYLAIRGRIIRLTPPAGWDVAELRSFKPEKWEGFFNLELILDEDDLRAGLDVFMKQNRETADKWSGLFVDFRPGSIFVRGKYDVSSGMNAAFKITSGLELRQGKQIWLVNTNIEINNAEQTDAICSEIRRINPPVDFTEVEIPLVLKTLTITDKEIRVMTATRPEAFPGITYRYRR